jgi:hypothetical protein
MEMARHRMNFESVTAAVKYAHHDASRGIPVKCDYQDRE